MFNFIVLVLHPCVYFLCFLSCATVMFILSIKGLWINDADDNEKVYLIILKTFKISRWSLRLWFTGLLLKRSTCLYSTKDRLKLVESFLLKVSFFTGYCDRYTVHYFLHWYHHHHHFICSVKWYDYYASCQTSDMWNRITALKKPSSCCIISHMMRLNVLFNNPMLQNADWM